MKLNDNQKEWITRLSELGFSSREIQARTGISKSAINYYLNGRSKPAVKQKDGPRILLFDLESAPSIVAAFKRFKVNIGSESVVREGGYIISACYKFLGEDKMTKLVQTPKEAKEGDDSRIVANLYVAFEEADLVVGHNAERFDVPLFKTRLIANGFPPPPTVKTVDTLKIAKTLKFNSNKLDSLGHYLDVGRKVETSGMGLWLRCMDGDRQALKTMLEYNEQDVNLLEQVYLKLRAFDIKPANAGQYFKDNEVHCPVCGSTDLDFTGNTVKTSVSEFPEVACNDCGHRSRTRQSTSTKESRAKLLVTPQK
jgi:DNA-directed RNA polymerase subunit RPC12/RpoP